MSQISLCGRIAVVADDRTSEDQVLGGGQTRLVFAMLACRAGQAVRRAVFAENLWPHVRPDTWRTALRGVVTRVRDFVVGSGIGDREAIKATDGGYRLWLPPETVLDIDDAVDHADEARRALDEGAVIPARRLAEQAQAVLTQPFLPGLGGPWLDTKRAELASVLVSTLQHLAASRLALGDHDDAVAAAHDALQLDPFRESAHRLVMQAHLAAGNTALGLRAYERCRSLLSRELGADPDPETQALHAVLLEPCSQGVDERSVVERFSC